MSNILDRSNRKGKPKKAGDPDDRKFRPLDNPAVEDTPPDNPNWYFFHRVDELLKDRFSESEASEFAFMSRNAYGNAKDKLSPIGIDFADGLARLLNVSLHYLITGLGPVGTYLPAGFEAPAADRALDGAVRLAKATKIDPRAIALVSSQNPDPNLGLGRIYALMQRAHAMYAKKDARKPAAPKKPASLPSPKRARQR